MAIPIKVEIDPASQAEVMNALHRIADLVNKKMYPILMQLAIYACQSARKLTPISKKKRPIRAMTKEEKEKFTYMKYAIEKYRKDGTVQWIYARDKDSKKRQITTRGAARLSWNGVIKKMGSFDDAIRMADEMEGIPNNSSTVMQNKTPPQAWIDITNHIKYIAKYVPNLEEQATILAEKRLLGNYMRKLGDDAEKIWQK